MLQVKSRWRPLRCGEQPEGQQVEQMLEGQLMVTTFCFLHQQVGNAAWRRPTTCDQ